MAISTAIDASAVARVVGIKTEFVDLRAGAAILLPMRIALIGQGSTVATFATTKRRVSSSTEVGQLYGFGSPLHLAARQLLPTHGDGVGSIPVTVYPFEDAGSSVAATADVTPTGSATASGTVTILVNGQPSGAVAITTGDAPAAVVAAMVSAVNGAVNLPVLAADDTSKVTLTSKWTGTSANALVVSVEGSVGGVTFAVTAATGGTTDPDIDDALNQFGDVWETLVMSCFDPVIATFDKLSNFNEGRWTPMVRRPFIAFHGSNEASVNTATVVTDARGADRTNCQLVAPGSVNFPFEIAARQLARVAVLANNNPPRDYGSQSANGLIPGTDAEQWIYVQRDQAVKAGSSTIEVRDGIVTLSDTVTFYHPEGDALPPYRFVVDIIKVMNVIFNVDLIFNTPAWDGAPLLPNDQPTTNRAARKPKDAIAAVNSLLDSLGLEAIISDPETAKASTVAGISTSNPKRLDIATTVQVSGNDNITSIDLNWGFFFGTPSII